MLSSAIQPTGVAMTTLSHLLDLLGTIPDPRRPQGWMYTLPHLVLFAILTVVAGANSYRSIHSFIDVHLDRLKAIFGLGWRRAPGRAWPPWTNQSTPRSRPCILFRSAQHPSPTPASPLWQRPSRPARTLQGPPQQIDAVIAADRYRVRSQRLRRIYRLILRVNSSFSPTLGRLRPMPNRQLILRDLLLTISDCFFNPQGPLMD